MVTIKIFVRKIFWIVLLTLSYESMSAQENLLSTDSIATGYLQTTGIYSALYYGQEYENQLSAKNHPYFVDNQYAKALLSYQQTIYPEVYLRYDINRDELIVLSQDFRNIVLFPEKVTYAKLHGKHIIYFQIDTLPGCPSSGYYFLLHSGNCMVMEKRFAFMKEQAGQRTVERRFELKTRYYLFKDGRYFLINSKSGLLNALHPFDKELKRFITSNRLKFKKSTEEFLIRTVKEYEKLSGL